MDNYAPPSSRFHGVDGAFFGTTFPHLLFQCYKDLAPAPVTQVDDTRKPPHARIYTPRIYGFKVSEHAKSGPRMRWMRLRPETTAQLESSSLPSNE